MLQHPSLVLQLLSCRQLDSEDVLIPEAPGWCLEFCLCLGLFQKGTVSVNRQGHSMNCARTVMSRLTLRCSSCLASSCLAMAKRQTLTIALRLQAATPVAAVKRIVASRACHQLPLRTARAARALRELRVHYLECHHVRRGGQAGHAAGQQAPCMNGIL